MSARMPRFVPPSSPSRLAARRLRGGAVAGRPVRADEPRDLRGSRRGRRRGDEARDPDVHRRRAGADPPGGVERLQQHRRPDFGGQRPAAGQARQVRQRHGPRDAEHGLGVGGMFDLASMVGIERGNEDFGQTFGVWGFDQGPYLFVPLFGPTTVRDGTGWIARIAVGPVGFIPDVPVRNSSTAWAPSTSARRRWRRPRSSTPRRSTATCSSAMPICSGAATSSTTASRRPNPRKNR